MEIVNDLFKYGLFFSNWQFIAIIFTVGYLIIDRTNFALCILLYLCSLVINSWLKGFFQIPLNPAVFSSPGWAFPSGHTQGIANILLYLCWCYRFPWVWIASLCSFIISINSMVHFGYHNWLDIGAGFAVALLVVSSFIFSYKSIPLHRYAWGAILVAINIVVSALVISRGDINYYVVCSISSVAFAFYFGWIAFELEENKKYSYLKIAALLLVNLGAILLFTLSYKVKISTPLTVLRGVVLGFWGGYVTLATHASFKRYRRDIKRIISSLLESHIRY